MRRTPLPPVTGELVRRYALQRGWREVGVVRGRQSILRNLDTQPDIVLAVHADAPDAGDLIRDALAILSVIEDRPFHDLAHDVVDEGLDTVRVRRSAGTSDGTIPLAAGIDLFTGVRLGFAAASRAQLERQGHYVGKLPAIADSHLARLRLGQTEVSSYVVTVLSPAASITSDPDAMHVGESGFGRSVTALLISSIGKLVEVAQTAHERGDAREFRDAIQDGVSANLCDAVNTMIGVHGPERFVELSADLSPLFPSSGLPPVRVESALIPAIRDGAEELRTSFEPRDFLATGPVYALARTGGEAQGEVGISMEIDGRERMVKVRLPDDQYAEAINAHQLGQTVFCKGTLRYSGKIYRLTEPTDFQIMDITL